MEYDFDFFFQWGMLNTIENKKFKRRKLEKLLLGMHGFELVFDILNYRIAWIVDPHSFYAGVDLVFLTKFESSLQKNM